MESKDPAAAASSEPPTGSSVTSSFQYPYSSGNDYLLDNKSTALNDDNGDNSRNNDVRGTVSEDEDYLSGEEEFVMALDKPVLDETLGEDIRDGNFDAEPVSDVILDDGGGVGKGENSEAKVGGEGASDGKGEIVDSYKQVLESGGEFVDVNEDEFEEGKGKESGLFMLSEPQEKVASEVAAEGVEKHEEGSGKEGGSRSLSIGDELDEPQEKKVSEVADEVYVEATEKQRESGSLLVGDELSEPQEKVVSEVAVSVEPEESQSAGGGNENVMPTEDSVVDTIQVDVVYPRVAVVGETEENGRVADKLEEKEAQSGGAGDAKAMPTGDSVVNAIQVDLVYPGVAVVGETEENGYAADKLEEKKSHSGVAGDANAMHTGDSVVDTFQVDTVYPGVAVVGETEENGHVTDKLGEKKSHSGGAGDANAMPTGDSVVDAIQVDAVYPGVAVVGETEENGHVVDKLEEKKSHSGGASDANAMPSGDSVVDTIQVDVVPGVAVVGETQENGHVADKLEEKKSHSGGAGDANAMPMGDSVVDTIQVDVVYPGVVVVGETEENGHVVDKPEEKDIPEVVVANSAADTLKNGDNIEEEDIRMVTVDNQSSDAGDNTGDAVELKVVEPEHSVAGVEKEEKSDGGAADGLVNGVHTSVTSNDSVSTGGILSSDDSLKKPEADNVPAPISGGSENGITSNKNADGDSAGPNQTNGGNTSVHGQNSGVADGESEEPKWTVSVEPKAIPKEIREVEDEEDGVHLEDSMSDGGAEDIFGGSEAAKQFIEQLERESGEGSHAGADSLLEQSQVADGQIVTDSEEGDTDDGGDGKELFDSAALAALLRAASGSDTGSNSITITSQDGSQLFTVERPAGLGSSLQSLRPAPRPHHPNFFSASTHAGGGESEDNLSEEEKKKLEKLQQIRVKFLRLVHKLGLSPDESVAAQVLYRLALLGGRPGNQTFSLDAAKNMALQLEEGGNDDLDFSVNILVIGKAGTGKSATINSLFGEEKASIDAFETGTASAQQISGIINGVKVNVIDTPGLKSSVVEQGFNRRALSYVKKFTKKNPLDVLLYVDRLDAQSRDLNDLPLLKTLTNTLGSSIWRNAIVTLSHGASAPPEGPSGAPLSYEVYVSQRSHVVQQSIGHAVGDLRMMSPSLMNPVSLVENHPSCRKNREGQKILPNGQSWRPQLLLLCYSMKILSEASSVSKQQDPFDHRKLFGFRARSPPLPYMLSSMLQSRPHPKLPSDQGGDNADSDIDLDEFSDSDQEEEDEYNQLPPFKPLKKAQVAKLTKEQKAAYFEEYDYRVKLLQKKQWKEELRRMREVKKKGKDTAADYCTPEEEDADPGAAAPVAVPLPDMALPPSFDGDNPAYRYRYLEPVSSFLARPVLDSHGWDHDCGYDGVNLEHSLAIANCFPVAYTVQISKDKKDFSISLDSSVSVKHGEKISSMAGFDVQAIGKQLAYVLRAETKFRNLRKNKAAGGVSISFLGENVVPGVKVEDQISLGKQYTLVGSAGAVRSQHDTAYGANFELQRRELDYPIGQVQSTLSMSVIKWRGDLALGFNSLMQFSIGRNSKVAVRAGINNKLSGQVTVRTSSSEHLSLALAAVIPTVLSIYRKVCPGAGDKYSIY